MKWEDNILNILFIEVMLKRININNHEVVEWEDFKEIWFKLQKGEEKQ